MEAKQYDDEHDHTRDDESCPECHEFESHASGCNWACVRCGGTKDSTDDEFCHACHEEGHGWE